ncbi:MAG: hypothetical protein OXJ37_23495 [Bryobacterales bacterium]|nr:hypothetical protein [Bryobacterales bacterium]
MNSLCKAIGLAAFAAAFGALFAQGPPGMSRMLPVMAALDANADDTLSEEEIGAAPDALLTLDADRSGSLSRDELMPRFGGGPGGGRGGGRQARPGDPGAGQRPGRGGPGGPPGIPLMAALDADRDGEVGPEEIRQATASLATLDADGSGSLTTDELLPQFGGRGGPGRGQGRPPVALPVVDVLDANADREISAAELAAASSALRSLDSDGDGHVGESEMLPAGGTFSGRQRGGPRDPGAMLRTLPVVNALDVDGSGALERAEIEDASKALATLDTDGSGTLSAREFLPSRGGGGRGGGGFRGGPGGFGEVAAERKQPHELTPDEGAATIPDRETFEKFSYQGEQVMVDSGLRGLEFVKFVITEATSDAPQMYFMNTENFRAHPQFMRSVGLGFGGRGGQSGTMRGVLVFRPLLTAPSGAAGLYTFEFEPRDSYPFEMIRMAHDQLSEHAPIVAGRLAYYPLPAAVARYEQEREQYEAAGLAVFREEDLFGGIAYLPLNAAEGFGYLRLMSPEDRPRARDVVLYESLPNEMPRVAGIITSVRQTPLSHVNLRAVQDGVPNAYVRGASENHEIVGLLGKYVRYNVTPDGYQLREATVQEVESHFAKLRPSEALVPKRDLGVKGIRPLSELGFDDAASVGVKAANVATLGSLDFPAGVVPVGFAIPFYFYDRFMRHNGLYEQAAAMFAGPGFATDTGVREEALRQFRKAVRAGEMPGWMLADLQSMHGRFPEGRAIRLRSSTNNEDLPGFSGAGLYDSFTHHPDEGHISKSVKQVYASLWNFRAYEERAFFRIDHMAAAMGVLVHPNYSGERANGVAVTEDIVYQTGGDGRPRTYYVNAQVGEDLVTNPEGASIPEELLLSTRGARDDRFIRSSNRTPDGSVILNDEHRNELRAYLRTVHGTFRDLYRVAAGERFAMEIEFKITSDGRLAVKQARPWVFH